MVVEYTTTSMEIAKITGKRHYHVMRDIREKLGRLGIPVRDFETTYINPNNHQEYPIFILPPEHTKTIMIGYGYQKTGDFWIKNAFYKIKIEGRWVNA